MTTNSYLLINSTTAHTYRPVTSRWMLTLFKTCRSPMAVTRGPPPQRSRTRQRRRPALGRHVRHRPDAAFRYTTAVHTGT